MMPILLASKTVEKAWGAEYVLCNNEEFCGKVLVFKAGAKFSMHFHRNKREVFAMRKGSVNLIWIDTADARRVVLPLGVGDVVEIPRFMPHQIEALEDSEITEFSTHHEDSDSYRVAPGDSQGGG